MAPQGVKNSDGVLISWAAFRSRECYLGHFHPHHQCGICGGVFEFNDRCVGLLGNPESIASWLFTRPFLFPDYSYTLRAVDGWCLCRRPNCGQCASSPEAASMHLECFELFRQSYLPINALDRLWRVAAWRKPWRSFPAVVLPEGTAIGSGALVEVAEGYGLPQLGRMPLEIVHLVRDFSTSALFWRLVSALDLAARFRTLPVDDFISVPLPEVAGWERGSPPLKSKDLSHLPIVRLTIDSRGLRKVERLPADELKYSSRRFDNMVFIIKHVAHLTGVVALFKEGRVRLNLPEHYPGFHIWDTPTPLALSWPHSPQTFEISFYGRIPQSTRFSTIDMSSVTGLTFFFSGGTFSAIHAHTRAAPYAVMPPESYSRRTRHFFSWVYVPIPRNDQVLALAVRVADLTELETRHCILFHTKLAGDISVGPWVPGKCYPYLLAIPLKTLIYNRGERVHASMIGGFPRAIPSNWVKTIFNQTGPQDCPFTFPNASDATNFSSAPLENVTIAKTFHEESSPFCRGLLLTYENGAQRALGDCRLGVDLCQTYKNPQFLCACAVRTRSPRSRREVQLVKVKFTENSTHGHEEEGWECYKMNGILQFWFDSEERCLNVLSPDSVSSVAPT